MEGLNQKKSQEVFGSTSDNILNKILERVKKDSPKEKMYQLYNEGNEQNDETKLKQAREMFAKALGKCIGEAGYIFKHLDLTQIKPFLEEYRIEGLDPQEILNILCSSTIQIIQDLEDLIQAEHCPLPKYTIARLIQSFDSDFIVPQMSLPSGYQQIPAISNDAAKEDETVESKTSEIKQKSNFIKVRSFFQNRKNKKTMSATSVAIGICMVCGGIIYALNSDDKNKKTAGFSIATVSAVAICVSAYFGKLFSRPPKLWYVGREFILDNNFLAKRIDSIDNGSISIDCDTYRYKDLFNLFNRLTLTLNGTHPELKKAFPKKEDRDLYIEVARTYVKTWCNMAEEFPDVTEAIISKKKERDKRSYFLRRISPDRPSAPYDWNKVFLDTDPQPWGPGRKPEDWREGDGIVEEDNLPFTTLDLSSFPTCECSEPKIG
jgi:hypothetical protein